MKYRLKVNCKKDRLKEIRDFVKEALHSYEACDVKLNQLVLAVDEVCANLIIHANGCNPDKCLELDIKVDDGKGITIEIIDFGQTFDYNNYQTPTIDELIKSRRQGGLGMRLIKEIMDDVEFLQVNNRNTCRLYKKLDSCS